MVAVHTQARLKVEPTAGAAGAYVTGIDLSKPLDEEDLAGLRRALLRHQVVALPEQRISLDDLERLTDALGGRDVTPFVKPMEDRPYVIRILKEKEEKLNFAQCVAHRSFLPARAAEFHAALLPRSAAGGRGYGVGPINPWPMKRFRPDCAETLRGLDAVHSAGMAYGTGGYLDGVKEKMSPPSRRQKMPIANIRTPR